MNKRDEKRTANEELVINTPKKIEAAIVVT